jgi:hypothetical protein
MPHPSTRKEMGWSRQMSPQVGAQFSTTGCIPLTSDDSIPSLFWLTGEACETPAPCEGPGFDATRIFHGFADTRNLMENAMAEWAALPVPTPYFDRPRKGRCYGPTPSHLFSG